MFVTFVMCALLPVVALALISYLQVNRHLRAQTLDSLRHGIKFQTKAVNDRLQSLEKDLSMVGSWIGKHPLQRERALDERLRAELEEGFRSITLISGSGQLQPILNRSAINSWSLSADDYKHLATCQTLLAERETPASKPAIFMLQLIDLESFESGLLVAEILPDYLWTSMELENLPQDAHFFVLDSSSRVLFSSRSELVEFTDGLIANTRTSTIGHFEFNDRKEKYIASYSQLFLKPQYKLSHWTLIFFKSKSHVFSPLSRFKKIFPLFILLTLILVLWLSGVNIRRNLIPIGALKNGARQIARKNFHKPVTIQSGDEFEELSLAFNDMSRQLERQFNELKLSAELGEQITSIISTDALCAATLNLIRRYLAFDAGAVLLLDEEKRTHILAGSFGFSRQEMVGLQKLPFAAGMTKPYRIVPSCNTPEKEDQPTDNNMNPFRPLHFEHLMCVPLFYESRLLGNMLLLHRNSQWTDAENRNDLLSGIAAQLAVRFTNISAFRKIKESEERFRKAFEHSAAGMLLTSTDGKFLKVNSLFCKMVGYTDSDLLSKSYMEMIYSEDLDRCRISLDRIAKGEIDADAFEARFVHRNGKEIWTFICTSLLKSISGEPLHFITLVQDLSLQKQAQHEKQQLEAQLIQAQKLESLGTLAGGIAHDFNNILSGISGYTQLSLLAADGNETIRSNLEEVMNATGRATELVKQILTFSRQSEPEKKPLQISLLIKEALKLLRATIPSHIEIIQHISNEPGVVLADPTQIHQVVMNLCTNAYHAIEELNSGTIRVDLTHESRLPEGLISHGVKKSPMQKTGAYFKLTISDTGCGMEPEVLKRIFEPYYSTKEKGKGTGLGLSVVHGIIKEHDGIIDVRSKPGKGTTFDIFFPKSPSTCTAASAAQKKFPTGCERILFVDDEADITRISQAMLSQLGYTVTCKNDPLNALKTFKEGPFEYDLVITDMSMPKMTGDILSAEIFNIRPEMPIILTTGYNQIKKQQQNVRPIFKDYLMKPVTFERLAFTVRNILDGS